MERQAGRGSLSERGGDVTQERDLGVKKQARGRTTAIT